MRVSRKESFVLYHDIREPLKMLSDEDRGKLFLAVLDYSEFGELPELPDAAMIAFAFLRRSIDRDAQAWNDKRERRAEAGRRGGNRTRDKRLGAQDADAADEQSADFAGDETANGGNACFAGDETANGGNACFAGDGAAKGSKSDFAEIDAANQAVPVPVPAPAPVPAPVPVPGKRKRQSAARFVPPTAEEVRAYCRERGTRIDAERFVNYYASKGWLVGRSPMRDWEAAVRTWEQGLSPPRGGVKTAEDYEDGEVFSLG